MDGRSHSGGTLTTLGALAALLLGTLTHGACGGDTEVEPAAAERWSFSQPAFSDSTDHWAAPFIEALALKGVVAGYSDGTFKPDAIVKRAELAALINAAYKPSPIRPAITFSDLPASHWAHGAVDVAVRGGFLSGYPSGVFLPDSPVKRIEVLAALVGGLKLSPDWNLGVTDFYLDRKATPAWAETAAVTATHHDLVANYPVPYLLRPAPAATRAEVAVAIYQGLRSKGQVPAIASDYLVGSHLGVGIREQVRTEQLVFSSDSKHALLLQSHVDSGAGVPRAWTALVNLKGNACVPGGCVSSTLQEGTSATRADAVTEVLTKTWSLRKSLGLTPPLSGTPLPETGRQAPAPGTSVAYFRAQARNATLTVNLEQQVKTCHDAKKACDYPCASFRLTVEEGHNQAVLGSLGSFRPWVHGYRIKGAVLAPDGYGVAILLEEHRQGFECLAIHTTLQTLEGIFAH